MNNLFSGIFFALQTQNKLNELLAKIIPGGINTQPLQRFPATLTLVYLIGFTIITAVLLLGVFMYRKPENTIAEQNLPAEVRRKLGSTSANRSLWIFRVVFVFLAFGVFGCHVYWTLYAAEENERFSQLSSRDARSRRATNSQLRGWILDRTGQLNNSLAYWRVKKETKNGKTDVDLVRDFPLQTQFSHLLGTELGTPGLERALPSRLPAVQDRESLQWLAPYNPPKDSERDIVLTLSRDLQQTAADEFAKVGKNGAIVVINPQNGEVLAMYSHPSFKLGDINDFADYVNLEEDKKNRPLTNRALVEYYAPGSTFKTFTMASAFRSGQQNAIFASTPGGYIPFRGSRSITDANGGCEPPYGCVPLDIAKAFEVSSNQYFAQMAVTLGRDRLRETALAVGIEPVETPEQALLQRFFPEIWNTTTPQIRNAIAPRHSTLVTGKDISAYDIGLEGMGQGYAGQMTPFQMALIAAAVGNVEGKLMKPKIELDRQPESFSQVVSAQQAAQIRGIMSLVTEGAGGTASRVFAPVKALGIRTGGKTGTAEKLVPVFDPKTNQPKTVKVKRKRKNGEEYEVEKLVLVDRTDSWYLSLAPIDKPMVAIAVVVEGGGFGATTAAPIAAKIVMKARELGLLGDEYKPKATQITPPKSTPTAPKRKR